MGISFDGPNRMLHGPGRILMTAKDEREEGGQTKVTTGPVAFALERRKGRVFHTYLGHFILHTVIGDFRK